MRENSPGRFELEEFLRAVRLPDGRKLPFIAVLRNSQQWSTSFRVTLPIPARRIVSTARSATVGVRVIPAVWRRCPPVGNRRPHTSKKGGVVAEGEIEPAHG